MAPPRLRGGGAAPGFGAKPQLDVAPPPFLAKKKQKRVRKIIEEEFEDVEAVEDPRARALVRRWVIICAVVAIPVFAGCFYYGKSRQTWALESRSRDQATSLAEKLTQAGPVLEQVHTKTAAALVKGQAFEVDESYLDFVRDVSEGRPLPSSSLDNLNFAAFEPGTVDGLFELTRTLDTLWSDMSSHRNLTKTDLAALQSARKMGTPPNQVRFGVVLLNLDAETYGGSLAVLSNPAVDDEGNQTFDIQIRPGRKSVPVKLWTKGTFGDNARDFVIPLDPVQTAAGGSLAKAEQSHFDRYNERLTGMEKLARRASELNGQLLQQLQAIAN